jgi:glycosyltransferase involved in cell wall biosynthesis
MEKKSVETIFFKNEKAPSSPLFTIITSTLNMARTIERCVESVASQTFDNYEYIIVDGVSKDGTVDYLLSRKELFYVLISEPDTGIYNAWNKALKHARGEWILFLGADDILADEKVLEDVAGFIKEKGADSGIVYGDVMLVSKESCEDKHLLFVPTEKIWLKSNSQMILPHIPPHPATFHCRRLFSKRQFDESYKIAADAKMLLEAFVLQRSECLYYKKTINKMTLGGISSAVGVQLIKEQIRLVRELGLPYSKITVSRMFIKTYVKVVLYRILGEENACCFLNFCRSLRG